MPDNTAPLNTIIDPETITQELYKRNVELHKERRRTEELLYRVSEAIFAVDENLNLTLFNHALERLLHVRSHEVLGKHVNDLINLTDEEGNQLDITSFFHIDKAVEPPKLPDTAILKTPAKDRFVHIKISPIETDQGYKEHLITMSDVTREKELERTKDEFISITSHELKTPMTIIKSYLWMLQTEKGGNLTDKQKNYINKAVNGTERMIALINDILNISRLEQGRMEFKIEAINIAEFIGEVKDEIEIKTNEKNLYLNVDIKGVENVYADRQKLREILINLVGNSVKFTQTGGITIRIAPTIDENYAKISVIDTGPGIEKDQLDKLFQKFHRVDSSYQTMAETGGTGLGLYIVKTYAQKMRGKVGVHSEGLNKGSTFWVTLPVNPQ